MDSRNGAILCVLSCVNMCATGVLLCVVVCDILCATPVVMCAILCVNTKALSGIQARDRCIHEIPGGYFMNTSACQRGCPFETPNGETVYIKFYELYI